MYFNEKLVCLRDIDFHWPISGFPMTHLFKLANQLRQNEGVSTGLFNIFRFVRVCIRWIWQFINYRPKLTPLCQKCNLNVIKRKNYLETSAIFLFIVGTTTSEKITRIKYPP